MTSPAIVKTPSEPTLGQVGLVDFPESVKFNSGVINIPAVRPEDLDKMIKIDGQIGGLYRILTIPLRGSSIEVRPKNRRSTSEANFIQEVLTYSYSEGGMVTPLGTVISTILRMLIDGWSPHEIVWSIRDGSVRVDKIDYRPVSTITPVLDSENNLVAYEQDLAKIDIKRMLDRKIRISQDKVMHFVNGPEWNSIFGRSSFIQAFYHYEKKHKLYYIAHIAAQINALRLRVIRTPQEKEKEIPKYLELVSKLGFNSTINLPQDVELDLLDIGNNFPDVLPLIQHHDTQAAKSLLAQVIDVGVEGRTGSFNLSDTHFDIFIVNLELMGDYIASVFNSVIIPKLIDWNFGTGNYPKIKFSPFDRQVKQLLFETYKRIIGAANLNVTPEFILETEQQVAKTLGLNLEYNDIEKYLSIFEEKMSKVGNGSESSSGTSDPDDRDRGARN